MQYQYKIGILGYGNMGEAIAKEITKKLYDKSDILVYAPRLNGSKKIDGITVAQDPKDIFSKCETAILTIKPQIFKSDYQDIAKYIKAKNVISVMAGIKSEYVQRVIGNDDINVIRIMPNTPCLYGAGMVCIQKVDNKEALKLVKDIFKSVGKILVIEEEQFDAVTAVSGSGPAYVMYWLESIINGGIDLGLSYDVAYKLTMQTFKGTLKLVEKSTKDHEISELIKNVCSPNGTTIEAINTLQFEDVSLSIKNAMKACYDKSKKLSK